MPWLAPVSWVFQTLAVFFLVGGHVATRSYASARARGIDVRTAGCGTRLARLFRPVAAVLALWTVVAVACWSTGPDVDDGAHAAETGPVPAVVPAGLRGADGGDPAVARLNPLWPLAVVLHVDLIRFGFGGPAWLGWINVAAGWLVPYTPGRGLGPGRADAGAPGWVLLIGGAAATAALVVWAGYPASMVGVPGAAVSNLNPPTLAAVTFGLAQCGAGPAAARAAAPRDAAARGLGGGGPASTSPR